MNTKHLSEVGDILKKKKNIRPTESEKESIIIFAMLNVQINIFFIFACIHVSTMRCENCTVRLSLHKMNHWFPSGISPARWQRMDMDAKLLLQTGWAIVTVSTLFKMHTHNQTLHVQKRTAVLSEASHVLSVVDSCFGGLVKFYCDFCRMSKSIKL